MINLLSLIGISYDNHISFYIIPYICKKDELILYDETKIIYLPQKEKGPPQRMSLSNPQDHRLLVSLVELTNALVRLYLKNLLYFLLSNC